MPNEWNDYLNEGQQENLPSETPPPVAPVGGQPTPPQSPDLNAFKSAVESQVDAKLAQIQEQLRYEQQQSQAILEWRQSNPELQEYEDYIGVNVRKVIASEAAEGRYPDFETVLKKATEQFKQVLPVGSKKEYSTTTFQGLDLGESKESKKALNPQEVAHKVATMPREEFLKLLNAS
jgi:ADP-heptose:LPS heptosyltransferase